MIGSSERPSLAEALAAIDAANLDDPRSHKGMPLALVQGRKAEAWVTRLDSKASDALRLAARAHHLRRWVVPRSNYRPGRAGYLRWRRDQRGRHAQELAAILDEAGINVWTRVRAAAIVAKKGLGADPEVQVFEDAVSLTFLETELPSVTDRVDDDDKMVEIMAKTLAKMSSAGRAAVFSIDLSFRSRRIRTRALDLYLECQDDPDPVVGGH